METKELICSMLTECTGKALCDSGDAYGRNWERNQKKTLSDFENEPEVEWCGDYHSISVFHYLNNGLELNEICDVFNELQSPAKDWDAENDCYGVSREAEEYLINEGFAFGRTFNSYNGESALSQIIQGTWLDLEGENYLLLQIHQGCDARGGYTDAKLFYVPEYENGALSEDVYGVVTKKDGTVLQVDTVYNGYSLTNENGDEVEIIEGDKVELELMKY